MSKQLGTLLITAILQVGCTMTIAPLDDQWITPGDDLGTPKLDESVTIQHGPDALAADLDPPAMVDMLAVGDGNAKLLFGSICTIDADCRSNLCRTFGRNLAAVRLCTQACTERTEKTACPKPPSEGECNNLGHCKF